MTPNPHLPPESTKMFSYAAATAAVLALATIRRTSHRPRVPPSRRGHYV